MTDLSEAMSDALGGVDRAADEVVPYLYEPERHSESLKTKLQ